MTRAIRLHALGIGIRIQPAGGQANLLGDEIRRAWSRCTAAADGSTADRDLGVEVSIVPGPPRGTPDSLTASTIDELLESLTQRITVEAITRRAGDLLMLHACALANPNTGLTAVFVGPSEMGKTTIAMTLGTTWGYVTDETVAVDRRGVLVPYPKPLSVVGSGLHKEQRSPDELGLLNAPGALTVATVVLLDRHPSHQGLGIERLPTLEAVALLAEHTSFLTALPSPLGRLVELVEGVGGLQRVTYGDAAELRPLLVETIGETS
jgi:hypothetical protein